MTSFTGRSDMIPPWNASRFDELEIEGDGNVLADENPACFKGSVPREPVILAIDLRRGREPDARVAPWVLAGRRRTFYLKRNLPSDSVDREIARDCELILTGPLHAR